MNLDTEYFLRVIQKEIQKGDLMDNKKHKKVGEILNYFEQYYIQYYILLHLWF